MQQAAVAISTTSGELTASRPSVLALWHLLSLDAPCVAALWTVLFAHVFGVALPWTAPLALALAVWMLYVVDRLADAAAGHALEERHRFHRRHSTAFAVCWLACAPVLMLLVLRLPHALRDGWLLLAVPLAAYVGAVHALHLRQVPKEPLIAVFFALAVAMPIVSDSVLPESLAAAVVLFALLCWLNCAAIASWESPRSGYLDPLSRTLARYLSLSAATVATLAVVFALQHGALRWVGLAVAAGAIALLALEHQRGRLGRTHLRALADAVLLTPLLVLPWIAWHAR